MLIKPPRLNADSLNFFKLRSRKSQHRKNNNNQITIYLSEKYHPRSSPLECKKTNRIKVLRYTRHKPQVLTNTTPLTLRSRHEKSYSERQTLAKKLHDPRKERHNCIPTYQPNKSNDKRKYSLNIKPINSPL